MTKIETERLYYFLIKIFDFNQEGIALRRCLFCDL